MEYELTLLTTLLIVGAGVIGGFINTLAGGGSMLTLPALMMLGMPADLANATNRVGVLMQSIAGAGEFYRKEHLPTRVILPVLLPTLIGTLVGAILASYLPTDWLKPVLLITMVGMAFVMLVRPATLAPPSETQPRSVKDSPGAAVGLLIAGIYGGFVQAGVGFILIAALAGGLRYDLIRTNALKVVCTAALSLLALIVFIVRDQVLWIPGLILAAGTVLGAILSVKFAINVGQVVLKWILFIMVTIVCLMAWMF